MRLRALFLAGIAFSAAHTVQASVLRVAPSGAPFSTIQSAVDAAVDGDTILVAPGMYAGFTLHDEALSIAVDPAGIVTTGAVVVEHTSAAKSVLLASLRVVATSGDALTARLNGGSIRIVGCELRGAHAVFGPPSSVLGSGAYVTGSSDVVFQGCTLTGGHGWDDYVFAPPGADALFTRGSRLALYGCTLVGGRGGWIPSDGSYDGGNGGDALETPDSFVLAHDTSFRGGDGGGGGDGDFLTPGGDGGGGGAGIRLYAATPATTPEVLTRQCTLLGGFGGPGGLWGGTNGFNGPSSWIGVGSIHTPAITAVATIATPLVWPVGSARTISVQAPPGSNVLLYTARGTAFVFEPASGYALHLAAPLIRRLALGTVPPSGSSSLSFVVPPLPLGSSSATWYLQALVAPFGASPTSNVLPVVVLAPGV